MSFRGRIRLTQIAVGGRGRQRSARNVPPQKFTDALAQMLHCEVTLNRSPNAILIPPVSSETMTAIESVSSVTPMPAR